MGIYIGSIYLESNIFYKTTYININHSNVSTSRNIVLRKKKLGKIKYNFIVSLFLKKNYENLSKVEGRLNKCQNVM